MKKAAKELDKIRLDYSASKQKKWIISAIGFIIFGASIFFASVITFHFSKVTYNRAPLTKFLSEKFPRYRMTDIATDEALLIGYAYDK